MVRVEGMNKGKNSPTIIEVETYLILEVTYLGGTDFPLS